MLRIIKMYTEKNCKRHGYARLPLPNGFGSLEALDGTDDSTSLYAGGDVRGVVASTADSPTSPSSLCPCRDMLSGDVGLG